MSLTSATRTNTGALLECGYAYQGGRGLALSGYAGGIFSLGMRAVHLPNSLEGQFDYLFEPSFSPVLARCEELGLPLLFHPLDGEVN